MTYKKFTIRNTEKAARAGSRWTGGITVRFPQNDYYRGKNRVFTGEPVANRKPRFRDGKVFVKYDCREFEVYAYALMMCEGYKAEIMWRTV